MPKKSLMYDLFESGHGYVIYKRYQSEGRQPSSMCRPEQCVIGNGLFGFCLRNASSCCCGVSLRKRSLVFSSLSRISSTFRPCVLCQVGKQCINTTRQRRRRKCSRKLILAEQKIIAKSKKIKGIGEKKLRQSTHNKSCRISRPFKCVRVRLRLFFNHLKNEKRMEET